MSWEEEKLSKDRLGKETEEECGCGGEKYERVERRNWARMDWEEKLLKDWLRELTEQEGTYILANKDTALKWGFGNEMIKIIY